MHFTKLHGIGNDYIYVDCFRNPMPHDPAGLSRVVSDRHFGIGSDGLILICPSEKADVRMRMYNADGSEAEMCGNGIRCLAKYAYEHDLARKETLAVETGRGVLQLQLLVHQGKVTAVTVDMGEPILAAAKIPTSWEGPNVVDKPLEDDWGEQVAELAVAAGLDPRITCVSMGNPHGVLY